MKKQIFQSFTGTDDQVTNKINNYLKLHDNYYITNINSNNYHYWQTVYIVFEYEDRKNDEQKRKTSL